MEQPFSVSSQDLIKRLEAKIGELYTTISALELQIENLQGQGVESPDSE